jgi:hypothetical protein
MSSNSLIHLCEESLNFCDREDDRHALWALGAGELTEGAEGHFENLGVNEDEGVKGLVLTAA